MQNIDRPNREQISRVTELLMRVPQDAARRRLGMLCVHGMWRGKDAWLVGYQWTRSIGAPRHDQIREEVLGHAPVLDDAIEMMANKIAGFDRQ